MGQIKAIGFDFGGVIGGDPSIGPEFNKQSAKLLGITTEEWRTVYFKFNYIHNTGGKGTKEEFWQKILEHLGQPEKFEQMFTLDKNLVDRYLVINQQIIELIDRLRRLGYKIGMLSNAANEVTTAIKHLNIAHHFDSFLFSSDIGAQKPDPVAFIKLAKSLEVSVMELVFVDDTQKSLSTAKQCGFTPILFEEYDKLVNDLKDLDISY